ncbi:MAG: hypothetical protein KBC73_25340 [Burkholderiaceae bacterium]|nr:hypothetical protein [Burkholderiaceae bacterium]
MQQVFLSFTYSPHPDHEDEAELLLKRVSVVLECMGLRVLTGEDLGGADVPDAVRERIAKCDALVALVMPWRDPLGNKVEPPWVRDEFTHATTLGKPGIRLLHKLFAATGMYKANEYIPVDPAEPTEALLKLMRTLALWKREQGRPMNIEITPDRADAQFEPGRVTRCEFQLFVNYEESDWRPAKVWREPGGLFAHLSGVREDARLRLRLQVDDDVWISPFHNPVGRVQLSRSTP